MDVEQVLRTLGGVARTETLVQRGIVPAQLARAVAGKRVQLREPGILAVPGVPDVFVQAVRHRGVLTCASAAGQYGLWLVREPAVAHLAAGNGLCRPDQGSPLAPEARVPPELGARPVLRPVPRYGPSGVVLGQPAVLHPAPLSFPVIGPPVAALEDVLVHALFCLPMPESVVMVESAVNLGLVHQDALRRQLPAEREVEARTALDLVEAGADSLWETLARILFRRFGIEARAEAWVHGVGVVHFLIGGYLIAEIDGLDSGPLGSLFTPGPWRDDAVGIAGCSVLRIRYRDLLDRPQQVAERIRLELRTRSRTRSPVEPMATASRGKEARMAS